MRRMLLAVLAMAWGCGDEVTVERSDLPLTGMCAGACLADDDCGPDYVCVPEYQRDEAFTCLVVGDEEWSPAFEYEARKADGWCLTDDHCGARQRCTLHHPINYCVPACASDDDCPMHEGAPGHTCINRRCEIGPLGSACGTDVPRVVVPHVEKPSGVCVSACADDIDCPGEFCRQ